MGSKPSSGLYYTDYLKLGQLLGSQQRRSEELGRPAHDEMLFIVVHQVYELWFKQIIFELDSVLELFNVNKIDEHRIGLIVSRLDRVTIIQKLLIQQLEVMESMTPLDFLDFRDLLVPASGFQSVQFRLIENKLGLDSSARLDYQDKPYDCMAKDGEKNTLKSSENQPSLLKLVERWLERTPFLKAGGFDFAAVYHQAVDKMLKKDEDIIRNNPSLSGHGKEVQLQMLTASRDHFEALFDSKRYAEMVKDGRRRISQKAMHAALLIMLYRDQPILHMPFQLLNELITMESLLTNWRHRHVLMVQRMIGRKIGTGGSLGQDYLKSTIDKHAIFTDFTNLSTFMIPRSALPVLPAQLQRDLGFLYEHGNP